MSSPGVAFARVLDVAPLGYVRGLLGEEACTLLDLLSGGTADEPMLRSVAAAAVSPEQVLSDSDRRKSFLEYLPAGKEGELAERLGWNKSGPASAFLEKCEWVAGQRQILLGFLGLIVERAPKAPPAFRGTAKAGYALFSHQRRAATRAHERLYADERRVVLHLPTGVGKTRTAMNMISDHLRAHEPTLVVWLARGSELLEQAASEFERAWASLGNRDVHVARMWGDATPDLTGVTDGIVVLGLDKAVAAIKRDRDFLDRLALKATLTVFDEAHQAIAPTYRRVTDALTLRRDSSLLGLTATPGRTWANIDEDRRLSEYFAQHKVMLEIEGHDNPVSALIEDGYLARPTFRTVAANSGMKLSRNDRHALADAFDVPEGVLTELSTNAQWNLQVVRTVLELSKEHTRILLFAASVEHSRLLVSTLAALGLDAEQVTADSSKQHRAKVIARFKGKSNRPMVLSNFGVLTTGFDAPAASAAVVARPTTSLVLYSQMVGRVIRGPKAGGTSTCEVVTVIDPELPGFGDVADAFTNWEDVWSSR
ncbi:DEAD/DEAH box helicase [Streptomyces corynorhini]|uniref:Restriction endonuclease n=1 Tax=Streptomyces corynorhini TaxID=2282652 RepID=A0A370B861_9ACTN|nr:DEAD/DEAH box helicase family protein [Streptomyces corynorhini]RDG37990.1 restriction endonuclease [Streptomyces corynorhini]